MSNRNKQNMSWRQAAETESPVDASMVLIKEGVLDWIIIINLLNLINIGLYNTGWITFKMDEFDVGWSIFFVMINCIPLILCNLMKRK